MNDLERHKKPSTEYRKIDDRFREEKLIGSKRHRRGHKLWKFDIENNIISEVEIEYRVIIGMDRKPRKQRKVQYQKGFLYCEALNKKNAAKHFVRMIEKMMDLQRPK